MREWPWFWILLGTLVVAMFVPLGLGGWPNVILFWVAVVGAIAYATYARRA